jgi:aquaporin Z
MKQQNVAALAAEGIGTFVLMLVVLSVSRLGYPFFTAIAAGVTVAAFVSVFSKISGGHFNPAITIGQLASRAIGLPKATGYIIVQCAAAVLGAMLFVELTGLKLGFTLHTTLDWKVLIAEVLGTFIFAVAVAMAIAQKLDGHKAAFTIGAGLFLGLVVSSLASLSVLNPALGFGLAATTGIDLNYLLGPIVGSLLGFGVVATIVCPADRGDAADKSTTATGLADKTAGKIASKKAITKKGSAKKATKK